MMWIDTDAAFSNSRASVWDLIAAYPRYDMLVSVHQQLDEGPDMPDNSSNCGVMIFRQSPFTVALLEWWLTTVDDSPDCCWEQDPFNYELPPHFNSNGVERLGYCYLNPPFPGANVDPPLPFMIFHSLGLPKDVKEESWVKYYPPVHGRGRTMSPGDACVYDNVSLHIGVEDWNNKWVSPACCVHAGVSEQGGKVSVSVESNNGDSFAGLIHIH